jgi:hypothetical protein
MANNFSTQPSFDRYKNSTATSLLKSCYVFFSEPYARDETFIKGTLLLIAGMLSIFLLAWPFFGGIAFYHEGIYHPFDIRNSGLLQATVANWNSSLFRPLDLLAGSLCKVETRDARFAVMLHWPAVIVMATSLWACCRNLFPATTAATFAIAWIWACLLSGTSICYWQIHTISQSWAAAAGLLLGTAMWSGIHVAQKGGLPVRQAAIAGAICLVGVLTKEVFYGWALGAAALPFAWSLLAKQIPWKRRMKIVMILVAPVVLVTTLFLVTRICFGGAGVLFRSSGSSSAQILDNTRYSASLGLNLPLNIFTLLVGAFCTGPSHYVRSQDALALRSLPLVGVILAWGIVAAPWCLSSCRRQLIADNQTLSRLVACFFPFSGMLAVIPMGHVSEVYVHGISFGSGLFFAWSILTLSRWFTASPLRKDAAIMGFLTASLGVVATIGIFSRAYNTQLDWVYSRELGQRMFRHQSRIAPSELSSTVVIPDWMYDGCNYSQIMQPPVDAVYVSKTLQFLNEAHPDRKLESARASSARTVTSRDLMIPDNAVPRRLRW